jgi:hypothetical protein
MTAKKPLDLSPDFGAFSYASACHTKWRKAPSLTKSLYAKAIFLMGKYREVGAVSICSGVLACGAGLSPGIGVKRLMVTAP